jgi:putative glutamine amidotransferase
MPAHMVDVVEGSKLAECVGAPRLGVNTIHHQSVAELGEGLVVSAVSPDDGVVEAIEMPGKRFVVGVQWHPEHMWRTRPHSRRLFSAFVNAAKKPGRTTGDSPQLCG